MIIAPLAVDEEARLAELLPYEPIRELVRGSLTSLTHLASELCATPMALVSIVDRTQQTFWAKCGIDADATPREVAFCAHAILGDDLLEVPDATLDLRFHDNPAVTGAPFVRFYAGAPLKTRRGQCLGTLCAIDVVPRRLTDVQRRQLRVLADQVMSQLELAVRIQETDRLAAAHARQAAELQQFAYRVSHDLRSPVTRIHGFAEVALDQIQCGEFAEAEACLERIMGSAGGLSKLIKDILDLTRADSASRAASTTDLDALVREVVATCADESEDRRVAVHVDAVHETVDLERGRMFQILSNLVSNAMKYSDPKNDAPFVSVKATRDGDAIRIEVADNGLGIPSEHHDRVFDMFERLHPGRADGSGLGMAIVKRHVEAMKGQIRFDSAPGVGTRFVVTLPIPSLH